MADSQAPDARGPRPGRGSAFVLASASPRRRELLARAGYAFEVVPSHVDESVAPGVLAEEVARELAERKARAVAASWTGAATCVLGADTVVALGLGAREQLLGKPADVDRARAMLASLSGTQHRVVTGLCVLRTSDGALRVDHETTSVHMREITPEELEAYAASGEWRDKAGGYAIQESADAFVTRLEGGGFDNVVGLPVARAGALLAQFGVLPPDPESS